MLEFMAPWMPGPGHAVSGSQIHSKFAKATIQHRLRELVSEIRLIKGAPATLYTDLQMVKDGTRPRSTSKPDRPFATLRLTLGQDELWLTSDRYRGIGCNIYALTRTIGAIRQIERDGGPGLLGRATAGFKALPARRHWTSVLGCQPHLNPELVRLRYRERLKEAHPDGGGSEEELAEVMAAYKDFLEESGL